MTLLVTHVSGEMERDPSLSALAELVDELAVADAEHPDVSVADESGRCLSAFGNGLLVWENADADDGAPRHMRNVGRTDVVRLFEALAAGDITAVEAGPWRPGYS